MCGLAGVLDPARRGDPGMAALAGAMAGRLAHRGPDEADDWADPAAGLGFGFRRLAILDLSPAARQPMVSADGKLAMVYNGEIYNHRALRAELTAAGVRNWRGHGDSEVLLAAVAQWGFVPALQRLNGMFAIALWDRAAQTLFLARDRLGEKPLYYGRLGGAVVFASELKALAAHPGWHGAIDRAALALFLRHDYVPAPYSAYRGIFKLPPGSCLRIAASGEFGDPTPYWSAAGRAATAAAAPFPGDAAAATGALQALIDEAVALRLEADVPLGAFLSGGVDSSTVVAAMQRARPGAVRTFTIGFPDSEYDEAPYAAAVARHLGTDHTEMQAGDGECQALLPGLAAIYDEPFADASQIPTLLLCRMTRAQVTVSLSGDGGDELFGGYGRYAAAARQWARVARAPRLWRCGAHRIARLLAGCEARPARRLRRHAELWAHDSAVALYRDHVSRWRPGDGLAAAAPGPFEAPLPGGLPSLEQAFMLLDATTYLPDDLLVKIDRASMAYGLEARAPLLDHRIAEFAWSLPPALAVGGGPKFLLREALKRRLPEDLVERPKRGFEPPLGRWLRTGLRGWADDLLAAPRLRRHGLLPAATVAARWSEHRSGRRNWTYPLWNVLVLEAWFDRQAAG